MVFLRNEMIGRCEEFLCFLGATSYLSERYCSKLCQLMVLLVLISLRLLERSSIRMPSARCLDNTLRHVIRGFRVGDCFRRSTNARNGKPKNFGKTQPKTNWQTWVDNSTEKKHPTNNSCVPRVFFGCFCWVFYPFLLAVLQFKAFGGLAGSDLAWSRRPLLLPREESEWGGLEKMVSGGFFKSSNV